MQKGIKSGMVIFCVYLCFSGCGKQTNDHSHQASKHESVKNIEVLETSEIDIHLSNDREPAGTIDFFPEKYFEQKEKVKFECNLEVPEEFDVSDFYMPVIKGETIVDSGKVFEKYVEGKTISEEYHYSVSDAPPWGQDVYVLEDGTLAGSDGGMIYVSPQTGIYIDFARANEFGAKKDIFDFGTGEQCVDQVKSELEEIGFPVSEYKFDWFSTSGEEHAVIEQNKLEEELTDYAHTNQDGWTDENNSYEIYGWQIYEGLPVFPQMMSSAMMRAFENYQKAPVSATYTKQGIIIMSVKPSYIFEASDEKMEFLTFPEIADAVDQRYCDLLDDGTYTVTRAKLAVRTYYGKNDELAAEPVWYFEVDHNSSVEVLLFNAVTGREIYMN